MGLQLCFSPRHAEFSASSKLGALVFLGKKVIYVFILGTDCKTPLGFCFCFNLRIKQDEKITLINQLSVELPPTWVFVFL